MWFSTHTIDFTNPRMQKINRGRIESFSFFNSLILATRFLDAVQSLYKECKNHAFILIVHIWSGRPEPRNNIADANAAPVHEFPVFRARLNVPVQLKTTILSGTTEGHVFFFRTFKRFSRWFYTIKFHQQTSRISFSCVWRHAYAPL